MVNVCVLCIRKLSTKCGCSLPLSLPASDIPDVGGDTSKALSQILDTAYNLEFNERTSTSAVRLLVERIKQAFGV